ncbi:FAD-dependent monooxygenase [Nocardia acidivorans]|uniref:FAD-dependent monooxygenase n=1 Tax=Nocardia acidivorans TaxID=404580 RepID=UPI000831710A|nr:FAD-dependent monooxygenase [Nocardia acidivorans]
MPAGTPSTGLPELRQRFAAWHDPIPSLLTAADPDAVLHNDIYELPALKSYVKGRIALLGDTAHAMTPNLGQGACQALEDAAVPARVAAQDGDLTRYDAERRPRTQMIAARSNGIGRVAQLGSPLAVRLRDTALRLIPSAAQFKALAPVMDWQG